MIRFDRLSLRGRLLLGILLPLFLLLALNGVSLYRQALRAANTAYDRTLLASAKVIGEQLSVHGFDDGAELRATVPYSALEAFEADNRSRMLYRVSNRYGELVSGYGELPFWRGRLPQRPPYAALVDFYDDHYQGVPVRVAVLLQPVVSDTGRGVSVIQVAETLELRQTLARQLLVETLWRQALLLAIIALVVVIVVQLATKPVRRLSAQLQARAEGDLTPLASDDAPRELRPLLDATNAVMDRLAHLLEHQKRFVRDAAHQLRTPLAVLKAQVQSARRADVEPQEALREIGQTVERATGLANQMLSLAKVEQLRHEPGGAVSDFAAAIRAMALELSPLMAQKDLDVELQVQPAPVAGHEWLLVELTGNLLANAIRHSPPGGRLSIELSVGGAECELRIADDGPGVPPALQARLFQPFSAGDARSGSGLGLAICHEIVASLGGAICLQNRVGQAGILGLDVTVRLPLANA